MRPELAIHDITCHIVWPIRPNVEKLKRVLKLDKSWFIVALTFPSKYFVAPEFKLSVSTWCQISVRWRQPFEGNTRIVKKWASSYKGTEALLFKAEKAQNVFTDILKNKFHDNYDIHCVRHFGPLDWPLFRIIVDGTQVAIRLGSSLNSQFRSLPTDLDALPLVCKQISFEQRTLQRAIDLSQSGYPTESALLAVAVLDSFIQRYLTALMTEKKIGEKSSNQLLRNVTTGRMSTYLDAVLKLASGHSLQDDNPDLFARMAVVNGKRNDAIHNGHELTRKDAYDACNVTYQVISYLSLLNPNFSEDLNKPAFFFYP